MNLGKRIVTCATLLALCCTPPLVFAQGQVELTAPQLQADLVVLRSALEQLHPGLYRYASEDVMLQRFEQLSIDFSHSLTLQQAFVRTSQFLAQIECGHTYTNFLNQDKGVASALFAGPRVPFYFNWIKDQMVVTRDFTPNGVLPAGTEIVTLNGVAASTILSELLTISRADGSNDAKRLANLNVDGDSRFETFDVFYPLFFPVSFDTLELAVILPNGATKEISVKPLSLEARAAAIEVREQNRKEGDAPVFEWTHLSSGGVDLRMPTWSLYNSKWNWRQWLNDHIDQAIDQSAPYLVIDLRGNEGGLDVGDVIASRLIGRGIAASELQRYVRYRTTPTTLDPYLDTWDQSFRNWGESAKELGVQPATLPPVRYFRLTKYDDDDSGSRVEPSGRRFQGKVYVLIDASNSSATFQFAQLVKANHLGVLVGEPTGGSQRGINGGAFFFLRLPNSHIEVDLPLIGTFAQAILPDSGIDPDVLVLRSRSDVVDGIDPDLRAVEALVDLHTHAHGD